MTAVRQAVDTSLYGGSDTTQADLLELWSYPRLDRQADVWIVEGPDGDVVAYGFFWAEGPPHEAIADQWVRPEHRGRGLSEVLLELGEARAAAMAAANGDGVPVSLAVFTDGGDGGRLELFARHGFAPAREFLRMEVVLETPPFVPVWPPGIEVRGFRRGRDDSAVHAAMEETFRDHYRPTRLDLDEWRALQFGRPDLDLGLWWVAWDGDQVAGSVLAIASTGDAASIDELGVRRPWRGRGLGRALLLHAFAGLYERGLRRMYLGVDSVNPTGAMRVYESAGMRPTRRHVVLEKDILPD
jgi:ribosomal protein S18 acetylase RimI-like enzyme